MGKRKKKSEGFFAVVHELRVGGVHRGVGGGGGHDGLSLERVALALGLRGACVRWVRDDRRNFLDQEIRGQADQSVRAGEQRVKAKIHITLKQGILDPQGKAIEHALGSLGFKNAGNVRVGKYMEVDVNETDRAKADAAVKSMCEKLLANTIVEEYRYELG
jgi:phosphoribosylformylglycinamidine synthase PurS subunit